MWTSISVIYLLGLAITGVTLYRTRMFREAHLVNTGAIVLWPVYWSLYLITLFMNRSRG
jgi:hypothetical protein